MRENNHGVSLDVWKRSSLAPVCKRRLPASVRASLPLPSAPGAQP